MASKGRLACRKVGKKAAARILARDRGTSVQHASRAIDLALTDYEDLIDLDQTPSGGSRYIFTKRGPNRLTVCTDTRVHSWDQPVKRRKKIDKSVLVIGAMGVVALAGAGYLIYKKVSA